MESIIQKERRCLVCHATAGLHRHHVFYGPRREASERNGLTVRLCGRHHNLSAQGVHFDHGLDMEIKALGQRAFEEGHSREEFVRLMGRSYL